MDHNRGGVGRVTAFGSQTPREESPDFTGHGASGNRGRGDPTESATENKPPRS